MGGQEDGVYAVGQVRANCPLRLLLRVAQLKQQSELLRRVYEDDDGVEVDEATVAEVLVEAPYDAVVGRVVLGEDGRPTGWQRCAFGRGG